MKVAVLGSGVVGVSTAWFLVRAGHEVVVLDRASGPARETSFANGGQISVSQSEPWANPSAPWQILQWLLRDDAPLLFRLRLDPAQWRWCWQFLLECRGRRAEANMRQMLALGRYSRDTLQQLRAELGLDYQQQTRGIVSLFHTQRQLDEAAHVAAQMRELGMDKHIISREELARIEPALAGIAPTLAGASYCPSDESGDVHLYTCAMAEHAARAGVEFRFNTRINALETDNGRISGVSVNLPEGNYRRVTADAYVLALGSYSPLLAAPLGIRLPIYPWKGYSATLPLRDPVSAPVASITDEAYKVVISRLGKRLRIAGTAELAGYSSSLNALRCQALLKRGQALMPDVADWDAAEFWSGLRPATPGNVPLIGRSRYANLYLNTGHGTLGWTEGAGSGRALAEIISGRTPPIDFAFQGM